MAVIRNGQIVLPNIWNSCTAAVFVVDWQKVLNVFCVSGSTALVNVKMIEMFNQIMADVYCSQKQRAQISERSGFNVERLRGKMDIVFDNCFMIEMLNDWQ